MYSKKEKIKLLESMLADLHNNKSPTVGIFNKDDILPIDFERRCKVKPLTINNYHVFHFSLTGLLPPYDEKDNNFRNEMNNYYRNKIFNAYDYNKYRHYFDEAMIIFYQYFRHKYKRSLKNRNKDYILDAIKDTGIISGDYWQKTGYANLGAQDKVDHIQVYIVDKKNFIDFYTYLENKHMSLKDTINLEQDYAQFIKELNKKEKQRKGINVPSSERDDLWF